jgi:hypothetical protein
MTARIGCRTFWFLVTVLGERPSADLAAGAFPVAGVAHGELAAPQARAVPVAFRVTEPALNFTLSRLR